MGVEELQEDGESVKPARQLSQQPLGLLFDQLLDRPADERTIGDCARMIVAVAQEPGFTDGTIR